MFVAESDERWRMDLRSRSYRAIDLRSGFIEGVFGKNDYNR